MFERLKRLVSSTGKGGLLPEADVVVNVDEIGVSCSRPDGSSEEVTWADLRAVIIETTDSGPFVTDVFWILVGEETGCVIPQGATGEDLLLTKLQSMPGFDNLAVIAAMGSTENQRFLCWQKETQESNESAT